MDSRIDADVLQDAIETQFQCAQCGHCCKGDGLVRIGPVEADRAAVAVGLTRHRFLKAYTLRIDQKQWIVRDRWVPSPHPAGEKEKWCIFLERGSDGLYRCQLHHAKPDQCQSFPAKWRNPDSLTTCVGLRHLLALLRRSNPTVPATEDPSPASMER